MRTNLLRRMSTFKVAPMYGYILNSMPSPWFSWIVLSTSVIATRG
jgi:hypothetical protein